jgi:hypothetical protein
LAKNSTHQLHLTIDRIIRLGVSPKLINRFSKILSVLAFSFSFISFAQISIPNTTPVVENFNSMNATTTAPANWRIHQNAAPTWAGGTNALGFQASSGSPATGGRYNWGTTGGADRALGVMTSGTYASPNSVIGFYRNTNASNLVQLSISYNLERYRINTANASVQFYYSTDGTNWTAVAAGDIAAATIGTGASAYGYGPQATFSVASFNIAALNIPTNGNIYLRWNLNTTGGSSQGIGIDDVSVTASFAGGCTPAAEPAAQASAVTVSEGCTTAQINFTNGDGTFRTIVMSTNCTITDPLDQTAYTSSSTFGSGSQTAAGDYVVYNGSAATTIISGLTPGTSYCFKIYEYNGNSANCTENYLSANFSTSFTTLAICATPQIRSILVNACTVDEGTDEVVIIANGNSALDVDDIQIDFPSGGSFCNSGCGGQTFVNNAAYVNSLNTLAGCALFIYATTIPANASVVVFTGSTPTMTFNYSSECPGGGPYYVLFCNNTNTTGRFANTADANRTLTVDFNGSTDAVTFFSSNANTGTDGDYVSFDNAGTPTYANTAACSTPIILPVDWLNFTVESEKNTAILDWTTLTERNNAYFEIEMADEKGEDFNQVGQVQGAGSSAAPKNYHYELQDIQEGYYYFRLRQVDFDGKSSFSEIRNVSITGDELAIKKIIREANVTHFILNEELKQGSIIRLHEITGKLVHESVFSGYSNQIDIDKALNGMLILSIEHPFYGISTFKVVLQ